MDKKNSPNIFDSQGSQDPPQKPANPNKVSDATVNQLLNRMEKMREELQKKLQEVFQKSGLTHDQIEKYLNNPNNFTSKQWEMVEKGRQNIEDKIYKAIGAEQKTRLVQKQKEKEGKERKGKTLGSRRNWIPMK